MDRKEGYNYAIDSGMLSEEDIFFKCSFALFRVKELNLGEKIIISLILSYTNRRMDFYMSNNSIGDVLGIDRSTVANIMKSLKEKELITTHMERNIETGNMKRFTMINKKIYNNLIKKYNGKGI
jgi:DNA-binding MarR family transcriptional regulator